MSTIDTKLKRIVSEQLGIDEGEITPDSSIIEDLGADSLDVVEVVMAVEEVFDIAIDEDTADELKTYGKLRAHVEHAAAGKKGAA